MTYLIGYAVLSTVAALVLWLRWRDAEARLRWTERPKQPPLERLVPPKAAPSAERPKQPPPRKRARGKR